MSKTRGIVLEPEVSRDVEPGVVTLYDRSRFANNGVMANVTWVQLPSGLWVMEFNGTSSKVNFNAPVSLQNFATKTVVFWYYAGAFTGTSREVIDFGYSLGTGDVVLLAYGANTVPLLLLSDGLATVLFAHGVNTWTQICYSYDGTTILYAKNGVVFDTDAQTGTMACAAAFLGGRGGTSKWYDGNLALLKVLRYALTPGQILQRYEATRSLFGV